MMEYVAALYAACLPVMFSGYQWSTGTLTVIETDDSL